LGVAVLAVSVGVAARLTKFVSQLLVHSIVHRRPSGVRGAC
jgi:hypothetical protein